MARNTRNHDNGSISNNATNPLPPTIQSPRLRLAPIPDGGVSAATSSGSSQEPDAAELAAMRRELLETSVPEPSDDPQTVQRQQAARAGLYGAPGDGAPGGVRHRGILVSPGYMCVSVCVRFRQVPRNSYAGPGTPDELRGRDLRNPAGPSTKAEAKKGRKAGRTTARRRAAKRRRKREDDGEGDGEDDGENDGEEDNKEEDNGEDDEARTTA
ncbi:hypothetical protein F4802DRAFT_599856 [Xylaria palmicola]|nr:hypothetical protein F4802DRAFT_599856 [Xylaria palmicola]